MSGMIGLLAVLRAEGEIKFEEDAVTALCPNLEAQIVTVNLRNANDATRNYVRQNVLLS